jgi:hypothetical protein
MRYGKKESTSITIEFDDVLILTAAKRYHCIYPQDDTASQRICILTPNNQHFLLAAHVDSFSFSMTMHDTSSIYSSASLSPNGSCFPRPPACSHTNVTFRFRALFSMLSRSIDIARQKGRMALLRYAGPDVPFVVIGDTTRQTLLESNAAVRALMTSAATAGVVPPTTFVEPIDVDDNFTSTVWIINERAASNGIVFNTYGFRFAER